MIDETLMLAFGLTKTEMERLSYLSEMDEIKKALDEIPP